MARNIHAGTVPGRTSGGTVTCFDFDVMGSAVGLSDAGGELVLVYFDDLTCTARPSPGCCPPLTASKS